jgi:hypothetical protein
MKRSRTIRLLLLGGVSAGALAGCKPEEVRKAPITESQLYTNDYHIAGVGYYHAPFRKWYALPYNHYDERNRRYFYGGQWAAAPHQSITNISSPSAETADLAEDMRLDVSRGGFGGTSSGIWFAGT